MAEVVDVVFIQDWDDAVETDDAPVFGERAAMAEYLTRWDFGNETDEAHTLGAEPYGTGDTLSTHVIGGRTYTLSTNGYLRYAGLTRAPLEGDTL